MRRVVAETLAGQVASRRVLEKAGMRHRGQRMGEVDGEPVELVVYEALPPHERGGGGSPVRGPAAARFGQIERW